MHDSIDIRSLVIPRNPLCVNGFSDFVPLTSYPYENFRTVRNPNFRTPGRFRFRTPAQYAGKARKPLFQWGWSLRTPSRQFDNPTTSAEHIVHIDGVVGSSPTVTTTQRSLRNQASLSFCPRLGYSFVVHKVRRGQGDGSPNIPNLRCKRNRWSM